MLKIIPNPDIDAFKKISEKVVENDGYCPCLLEKNQDTKCMCKDFREQDKPGFCHCGRFMKINVVEKVENNEKEE